MQATGKGWRAYVLTAQTVHVNSGSGVAAIQTLVEARLLDLHCITQRDEEVCGWESGYRNDDDPTGSWDV